MFEYKNKNIGPARTGFRGGFTLIELLVVISIIGMLSSIVLSSLQDARAKARDARRMSDIKQIQNALELYRNDNGRYPVIGSWAYFNSNGTDYLNQKTRWAALETALKPYISQLPTDPLQSTGANLPYNTMYSYGFYDNAYGCSQQWYMLVYQLEKANGRDNGVIACDGTIFKYGGTGLNTKIKTIGMGK